LLYIILELRVIVIKFGGISKMINWQLGQYYHNHLILTQELILHVVNLEEYNTLLAKEDVYYQHQIVLQTIGIVHHNKLDVNCVKIIIF